MLQTYCRGPGLLPLVLKGFAEQRQLLAEELMCGAVQTFGQSWRWFNEEIRGHLSVAATVELHVNCVCAHTHTLGVFKKINIFRQTCDRCTNSIPLPLTSPITCRGKCLDLAVGGPRGHSFIILGNYMYKSIYCPIPIIFLVVPISVALP